MGKYFFFFCGEEAQKSQYGLGLDVCEYNILKKQQVRISVSWQIGYIKGVYENIFINYLMAI